MTSINRAKTTIEELKKLFSKGRKPSEEDFARLIDTLNDEIDSELFYTKEEVNKLMECVKSENLEAVFPLIETIEEEIEKKADLDHTHIAYVNINDSLRDSDVKDLISVFKGIKTVEEVIKSSKY